MVEFESDIREQLEQKSNYLSISRTWLSPEPSSLHKWRAIHPHAWQLLNKGLRVGYPVVTLHEQCGTPEPGSAMSTLQIQMIFCCKDRSEAFVGFLPGGCPTLAAVRAIGYEMGFFETDTSRITYPDHALERSYAFEELSKSTLATCTDSLLLVYNMEYREGSCQNDFSFSGQQPNNNSICANVGDAAVLGIDSFEQSRIDRTMSTGADALVLCGSEEDRDRARVPAARVVP